MDPMARHRPWWPALLLIATLALAAITVVQEVAPRAAAAYEVGAESARDVSGGGANAAARMLSLDLARSVEVSAPAEADVDYSQQVPQIEVILPPPPPPPPPAPVAAAPARAASGVSINWGDATAFCQAINDQRAAAGLAGMSCTATSTRQVHATQMATAWTTIGGLPVWHQNDNIVGMGPNLSALMTAFMGSPSHQGQILESGFSQAAVACAWSPTPPEGYDPYLFCTADFW